MSARSFSLFISSSNSPMKMRKKSKRELQSSKQNFSCEINFLSFCIHLASISADSFFNFQTSNLYCNGSLYGQKKKKKLAT